MSYNLSQSIDMRGRENSPGGSVVYLCEFQNITAVTLSGTSYVSGITMSGSSLWYKFDMPRQNINFINTSTIDVPKGIFIFDKTVTFNIPGLQVAQLQLFDTLVRKDVGVIVKTNEGKYFLISKNNGMTITSNSNFALGLNPTDAIGSTIELQTIESERVYEIDPAYAESYVLALLS
jgi:hypothetical protein